MKEVNNQRDNWRHDSFGRKDGSSHFSTPVRKTDKLTRKFNKMSGLIPDEKAC